MKSPVDQAKSIRDIVQSIATIPDEIEGSLLLKKCSTLVSIEEEVLFTTYHEIRNKTKLPYLAQQTTKQFPKPNFFRKHNPYVDKKQIPFRSKLTTSIEAYEKEIIRILLTYGATKIAENQNF